MLQNIMVLLFVVLYGQIFADSSYIIRHVQKTDVAQLIKLYKRVAQTAQTIALRPHEVTHGYISKLIDAATLDGLGIVVEYEQQLVGYMLKERYPFETSRHVLYGGSIGIDPDHQGKGVGTQMISHFLSEVAANRPEILRVEIYALESNPAYRLYKRLGFVEEGILKDGKLYSDGRLESYYSMVWFNPNFKFVAL